MSLNLFLFTEHVVLEHFEEVFVELESLQARQLSACESHQFEKDCLSYNECCKMFHVVSLVKVSNRTKNRTCANISGFHFDTL